MIPEIIFLGGNWICQPQCAPWIPDYHCMLYKCNESVTGAKVIIQFLLGN